MSRLLFSPSAVSSYQRGGWRKGSRNTKPSVSLVLTRQLRHGCPSSSHRSSIALGLEPQGLRAIPRPCDWHDSLKLAGRETSFRQGVDQLFAGHLGRLVETDSHGVLRSVYPD